MIVTEITITSDKRGNSLKNSLPTVKGMKGVQSTMRILYPRALSITLLPLNKNAPP